MSFGGFIARRLFRGAVYGVIDTFADDNEQAKEMKEDVRWLITIVGAVVSIATADAVGFIDTITDHGTDVATDTVIDHVADHGVDAATEHLPSYYDGSDAITNDHELHLVANGKVPMALIIHPRQMSIGKRMGISTTQMGQHTKYKVI